MKTRASIEVDNALVQRGSFSQRQAAQLAKPLNPVRVLRTEGNSYLSQQDVKAHLIRVFGFGHFDLEVLEVELVYERGGEDGYTKPATETKPAYQAWDACYRALIRLTVRNEAQVVVTVLEDGSTATAQAQRNRGDAHDLAYKSAISLSVKRAAADLGDQFGLALYNKGQLKPLVGWPLVGMPDRDAAPEADVQDGVEEQVEDGLHDGGSTIYSDESQAEPEPPSALPPVTKRATNGRQGTRRAPLKKAEPETPPTDDKRPGAVIPTEVPDEPAAELPADHGTRVADENGSHIQSGGKPIPGTEVPREEAPADPQPEVAPDPASIDLDDEEAVIQYNKTWGKASGSYLTSHAEMARTDAKMRAEEDAAAERELRRQEAAEAEARQAAADAEPQETPEQVDARIKAERQARAAAEAAAAAVEPTPAEEATWDETADDAAPVNAYELAMAEEPENYKRRAEAATELEELRLTWNDANAAQGLSTDLKGYIIAKRKAIEAATN